MRRYLDPVLLNKTVLAVKKRHSFVPLDEAVDMLTGVRPLQGHKAVLTFDDGYRNNAREAWPVLKKLDVPATFFVVTSFVRRPRPFWFDRLDFAVQHLPESVRRLCLDELSEVPSFDVGNRAARRRALFAILAECKRRTPQRIERIVSAVEGLAGQDLGRALPHDEWTSVMDRDDIGRLVAEGGDVGSHTRDHTLLDSATDDEARTQLVQSKRAIEDWIARPCTSICYPSGRTNDRTARLVAESGYRCGLTTKEGSNRAGAEIMLLRRKAIHAFSPRRSRLAHFLGFPS